MDPLAEQLYEDAKELTPAEIVWLMVKLGAYLDLVGMDKDE